MPELTPEIIERLERAAGCVPWVPMDPYTGWASDQNLRALGDGPAHEARVAITDIVNHAPALIAAAKRDLARTALGKEAT